MKKQPDFSEEFQLAIREWRQRHALREDDAILLCIELFQIHQKHWDELRHRDLPSFTEFRESLLQLKSMAGSIQRDTAILIEELRRVQPRRPLSVSRFSALILAGLGCLAAGIVIGRYIL